MHTYYGIDPPTREFYRKTLRRLQEAEIPFIVGGGYALRYYTHIERELKDLDLFIKQSDFPRVQGALESIGMRTELTFPHWLGKATCDAGFIDVIFSSGNGIAAVDDEWLHHARRARVLDIEVPLSPPEEMIWSKAFIMERERFDGADIHHLLQVEGERLDWDRILRRFGTHWRVLLAHLTTFGFVYPCDRARIPARVMQELIGRLRQETEQASSIEGPQERVCQGTLLSRAQYLVDIDDWRYADARLKAPVNMSPEHVSQWTSAINESR